MIVFSRRSIAILVVGVLISGGNDCAGGLEQIVWNDAIQNKSFQPTKAPVESPDLSLELLAGSGGPRKVLAESGKLCLDVRGQLSRLPGLPLPSKLKEYLQEYGDPLAQCSEALQKRLCCLKLEGGGVRVSCREICSGDVAAG